VAGLRDEAPKLKTEDVIMCCLVRSVSQLRGAEIDQYGGNGGMMIIRAKLKELEGKIYISVIASTANLT
jgi:hypothetical protein